MGHPLERFFMDSVLLLNLVLSAISGQEQAVATVCRGPNTDNVQTGDGQRIAVKHNEVKEHLDSLRRISPEQVGRPGSGTCLDRSEAL